MQQFYDYLERKPQDHYGTFWLLIYQVTEYDAGPSPRLWYVISGVQTKTQQSQVPLFVPVVPPSLFRPLWAIKSVRRMWSNQREPDHAIAWALDEEGAKDALGFS